MFLHCITIIHLDVKKLKETKRNFSKRPPVIQIKLKVINILLFAYFTEKISKNIIQSLFWRKSNSPIFFLLYSNRYYRRLCPFIENFQAQNPIKYARNCIKYPKYKRFSTEVPFLRSHSQKYTLASRAKRTRTIFSNEVLFFSITFSKIDICRWTERRRGETVALRSMRASYRIRLSSRWNLSRWLERVHEARSAWLEDKLGPYENRILSVKRGWVQVWQSAVRLQEHVPAFIWRAEAYIHARWLASLAASLRPRRRNYFGNELPPRLIKSPRANVISTIRFLLRYSPGRSSSLI